MIPVAYVHGVITRSMDDIVQAKVAASIGAAGGFDRFRSFAVGQTIFGQTVRDRLAWRIDGNGAVGQTADCSRRQDVFPLPTTELRPSPRNPLNY